ncbi:ABC transporter permease [Porphyromonas macacae]|uniref:ABC transporter permease n=1 Tax=Porphyromonas macacae TaxID=28115 RepID=UPI00052BF120|nr:ABC transporter permease [Porphyromonas macacae]KGN99980.1 ABC transporter permease [Porphyromonas macacae]
MRTYLKYLGRNKLYTFVTVVGFAMSLTFVIMLGFYINRENNADTFQPDIACIYQLNYKSGMKGVSGPVSAYPSANMLREQMPDVEDVCHIGSCNDSEYIFRSDRESEGVISGRLGVDSNFFTFFTGYKLKEGNPATVLLDKNSTVISEWLANSLFGNESPIGKEICYVDWDKNKHTYKVSGIMKNMSDNSHLKPMSMLFVLEPNENWNSARYWSYLKAREGVDLSKQSAIAHKLLRGKDTKYRFDKETEAILYPMSRCYMEPVAELSMHPAAQYGSPARIRLLTGASLLILIIAIISYINLTLAQAGSRGREVALKKLLGSTRCAIVYQLWEESLVLIGVSTVMSLFGLFLMEPVFNKLLDTQLHLQDNFTFELGLVILGGMLLLSVICALLPAFFISRFKPVEVVSGKFRRIVKNRFSRIMLITQYTITMVMIACTLIIGAQVYFMTHGDLGYDYQNKLLVSVFGLEDTQVKTLHNEFGKMSGVRSVGRLTNSFFSVSINSYDYKGTQYYFCRFGMDSVALNAFGIKLPPVNLQNSSLPTLYMSKGAIRELGIEKMLPGENIHLSQTDFNFGGFVKDFRFGSFKEKQFNFLIEIRPEMPWLSGLMIDVVSQTSRTKLQNKAREIYAKVTGLPYTEMKWSEDLVAELSREEQSLNGFLQLFSLLALISTVMSVFAMSALRIRQKQKEVAIRKVFGARTSQIMQMVSRQSLWNLLISFVIATPIAYYLMQRWMQDYIYHITGYWWAFFVAWFTVAVVAFASMFSMTLNAANTNPVDYLKNE